jgi:hypothetical protein
MGRVFVVQESMKKVKGEWQRIHDLTPALTYGDIEILLDGNRYLPITSQPIINELKRKLSTYNDDDYLLCLGDPVAIGMSAVIASQRNYGKVTFLKWDREQERYLKIPCQF